MAHSVSGYFVGVGTIVAALVVGMWFLIGAPPTKEGSPTVARAEAIEIRDRAPEPSAASIPVPGARWVVAPPTKPLRDPTIAVLPVTPFTSPLPVPEGLPVVATRPALDASAEARPDEHISAREALRKKPVAAKPKSVDVKVKRGKDLDVVEVPREQPSEPTAMNDVGRLGSH